MILRSHYSNAHSESEQPFSEADFDWNNYTLITKGCLAIGCAYRAKYSKRSTDNEKRFADTWRYLLNRHNKFLKENGMDFLNNDEWFEMPLALLREKTEYKRYSFYYWRRFLDFAEENGLIKTKKAKTHGILHIQINFFALKQFILTHINQFWEKIQGWFKNYRQTNKTLTQIDLPDDFSADEVALFEELLKIRNEKHHLNNNQASQQELLNRLLEIEKDGCDRKTVMMKAVQKKLTKFYHPFKDEPMQFSKTKRRTNGFNSIGSFFQKE